jgi:peroxin-12
VVEVARQTLAERYPQYLLLVFQWQDELYALLALAVERHYMATTDAAFAEHFYGLRRMRTVHAHASAPLHTRDRRAAVVMAVLVPYILTKLEARFHALGGGLARDVPLARPDEGEPEDDPDDNEVRGARFSPWRSCTQMPLYMDACTFL